MGEAFRQGEQGSRRAVRSQTAASSRPGRGHWNDPRLSMAVRTVDKRERGQQAMTVHYATVAPKSCLGSYFCAAPPTPVRGRRAPV